MKYLFPLLFCLFLGACKGSKTSSKSDKSDTVRVTYIGTGQPIIHMPEKIKGSNTFIFAGENSKVESATTGKVKGSTQVTNQQTASGGSTIGASTQSGADYSKTKESSTSTAKTANTGGNGSEVSGGSEARAENTIKKGGGLPWWLWLGAAAYLGMSLWRKSLKPWRWIV